MILIALGANLSGPHGTPEQGLQAAIRIMPSKKLIIASMSRIWLSAPVPPSDQPWYKNAVIEIETTMSPQETILALKNMEADFGRDDRRRNAARALDLDLLAWNDLVLDEPALVLPHPRMQDRAFVLLPLQEIAPDWRHPVTGKSVPEMIAALPGDATAVPLDKTALAP